MTRNQATRHAALSAQILDTVPRARLIAAVGAILESRIRRETGTAQSVNLDVNVEAFLKTCTLRQLKMLRKIALGLDVSSEGSVH